MASVAVLEATVFSWTKDTGGGLCDTGAQCRREARCRTAAAVKTYLNTVARGILPFFIFHTCV